MSPIWLPDCSVRFSPEKERFPGIRRFQKTNKEDQACRLLIVFRLTGDDSIQTCGMMAVFRPPG
jgi:hypothetical protein